MSHCVETGSCKLAHMADCIEETCMRIAMYVKRLQALWTEYKLCNGHNHSCHDCMIMTVPRLEVTSKDSAF